MRISAYLTGSQISNTLFVVHFSVYPSETQFVENSTTTYLCYFMTADTWLMPLRPGTITHMTVIHYLKLSMGKGQVKEMSLKMFLKGII